MSQNIQLKRSSIPGKVPTTEQLNLGELAINTNDGKLYFKKNDGTESVVTILEVTEDNLSIDTTGYSQTSSSTLANVLSDLDTAINSAVAGGLQTVATDSSITGNGTTANPLSITEEINRVEAAAVAFSIALG
jgi:hypothetical protein